MAPSYLDKPLQTGSAHFHSHAQTFHKNPIFVTAARGSCPWLSRATQPACHGSSDFSFVHQRFPLLLFQQVPRPRLPPTFAASPPTPNISALCSQLSVSSTSSTSCGRRCEEGGSPGLLCNSVGKKKVSRPFVSSVQPDFTLCLE